MKSSETASFVKVPVVKRALSDDCGERSAWFLVVIILLMIVFIVGMKF